MKKKLWDPIFGGIMIGIAIILTFYISGRGLGASVRGLEGAPGRPPP